MSPLSIEEPVTVTRLRAIEAHGSHAVRDAIRSSAAQGDREALRALQLDDCYRLELRQMLEHIDCKSYDPAAELSKALLTL